MANSDNFYALILAGGGGTRLWPKSRKLTPKHLLRLYGDKTMLQQTYDRIAGLIPKERIFLITLKISVDDIVRQLPDLPKENIIAEPQGKNTALAMGMASFFIKKLNSDAAIVNIAADQLINDEKTFKKVIGEALEVAASSDNIVSVGIKPTFAHTGLGYINIGAQINEYSNSEKNQFVFKCVGFKEKPDLATAQSFIASGEYLWNANLYCWSVNTISKAFLDLAPDLYKQLEEIYNALGTESQDKVIEKVYEEAENVQIDVAVSEKAKNLVVVPGDFGWNDVGDWKVIFDTKEKNRDGNVVDCKEDNFVDINCHNCLIEGNDKLIAVVGLQDVVVIDTKDAILVCNKNNTQDVKKVIEKLKEKNLQKYL
jgi:mannose-1-phosphate guanylyltransferase